MGFPKVVPILDADEMYKGGVHEYTFGGKYTGRSCLLGWVWKTFGCANSAQRKAEKIILQITGAKLIPTWNDRKSVSKKKLADTWNQAMKQLGYTVPCERK